MQNSMVQRQPRNMVSPCGFLIPIPYSPSGLPQNPAVKKNPALPNFHHGCRENCDEPFENTPSKKNIQSDSDVSVLSANWVETEKRFAQTETWIARSPLFLSCPHGFSGATGC